MTANGDPLAVTVGEMADEIEALSAGCQRLWAEMQVLAQQSSDGSDPNMTAQLDALDAEAARLGKLIEDLSRPTPILTEPKYPFLHTWVESKLLPMVEEKFGGSSKWCREWWAHEMATQLLADMWRTWEVAQLDPIGGMAKWWREVYIPLGRGLLFDADGPFISCKDQHFRKPQPPTTPPPPDRVVPWAPRDTDEETATDE